MDERTRGSRADLSSGLTEGARWAAVITPSGLIALLATGAPARIGGPLAAAALAVVALAALAVAWRCVRLVHVAVEGQELIVRRPGLEVRLPMHAVLRVDAGAATLALHLREATPMGRVVWFLPMPGLVGDAVRHPHVVELVARARANLHPPVRAAP